MNRALQTWSPRTRPLKYDALIQDVGCQGTPAGKEVYGSLPFSQICVAEHSQATNSVFNQPDAVSYAVGPLHTGGPMPWATIWAAWVSASGIRIAKIPDVIMPANEAGSPSGLYGDAKPSKVSIGFTSKGQIALAIQKSPQTTEIKWFRDGGGVNIGTASFLGRSAVLFSNGLLRFTVSETSTDLVCYYLLAEKPGTLFARFERDDFAIEYVVNASLQASLVVLIASEPQGAKQVLFGRDIFGRDIKLSSSEYTPRAEGDAGRISVKVYSGNYYKSAVVKALPLERAKLSIAVVSGIYSDPIQEPTGILSGDAGSLTVSIDSGEYA